MSQLRMHAKSAFTLARRRAVRFRAKQKPLFSLDLVILIVAAGSRFPQFPMRNSILLRLN